MTNPPDDLSREEEQINLARLTGAELTEAFVAYVRGQLAFDELSFGVYDALHDLHVIASGEYELEDHGDDHHHDHEDEAIDEQEDLAQEPVRDDKQ